MRLSGLLLIEYFNCHNVHFLCTNPVFLQMSFAPRIREDGVSRKHFPLYNSQPPSCLRTDSSSKASLFFHIRPVLSPDIHTIIPSGRFSLYQYFKVFTDDALARVKFHGKPLVCQSFGALLPHPDKEVLRFYNK